MSFYNPYLLLLLIPVILLALYNAGASSFYRASMNYPSQPGFKPSQTALSKMADYLPFMLRLTALMLFIAALARPQDVKRTLLPNTAGVDIILCIDTSASMAALDFDPVNRIEAAKENAKDFIKKRTSDRIGIVAFAANAMLQCPLTLDYDSLLSYLDSVEIGMTRSDGTAIGDAIACAVNHLKNSQAKSKIIVLLTDGRSNTGIIADPVVAAKAAASYGIKIYTIGTAGKGPARVPINNPMLGMRYTTIDDDLDESTLLEIARVTGGEFFRATKLDELKNIYARIDSLETTRFKNPVDISYKDRYYVYLIPGILLLLAEFVMTRTVFMRLP